MALTVELAGFPISIEVAGAARSALTYCESYFAGFIRAAGDPVASVTIERSSGCAPTMPAGEYLLERRLTANQLRQRAGHPIDLEADTLCAGCLDGCLAFHPASRSARLYLGGPSGAMYAPLYRLMWMFFAQTLGDLGCFFVHAAAVAADDRGYLFWGDSGEGKSTLAANAQSGRVLADDGPIFTRMAGGGFEAHASPYHQAPDCSAPGCRASMSRAQIQAFYFLDRDGKHANARLGPSHAVPMLLQRFIHFWSYLSTAARLIAFDLFADACHTLPVSYRHVPKGVDALTLVG